MFFNFFKKNKISRDLEFTIRRAIKIFRSAEASPEYIIEILCENFPITEEQAKKYLKKY